MTRTQKPQIKVKQYQKVKTQLGNIEIKLINFSCLLHGNCMGTVAYHKVE